MSSSRAEPLLNSLGGRTLTNNCVDRLSPGDGGALPRERRRKERQCWESFPSGKGQEARGSRRGMGDSADLESSEGLPGPVTDREGWGCCRGATGH